MLHPIARFCYFVAELITGGCAPEVQLGGARMGIKVEKLESYDGGKHRDVCYIYYCAAAEQCSTA